MLEQRAIAEELMDAEDLPEDTYHLVLRDLAKVNRLTFAYRPTLQFIQRVRNRIDERRRKRVIARYPHANPKFAPTPLRILDVGFGAGDTMREVRTKSPGVRAHCTGIDLNPRSAALAASFTRGWEGMEYYTGDYRDLAGGNWDVIISSLVAHHMTHEQLISFLRFMEAEAREGWFINDLHRHGFAYTGYPLLARLMRWHPIVRHDGRLSIARSYRPAEWPPILAEAGITGASIERHFPFRLCVSKLR